MNVSQLREKARKGRVFITDKVYAELSGEDIDFYGATSNAHTMVCWVPAKAEDNAQVIDNVHIATDGFSHINNLIAVAQFLGMTVQDAKPIEIPVVRDVDRIVKEIEPSNLINEGKVQAYEKLLIGRQINIGK